MLISASRPLAALLANSASARSGRAIDTRSAAPSRNSASATAGSLIRFVAITGTLALALKPAVTHENAARGTMPAIVGTRFMPADAGGDQRDSARSSSLSSHTASSNVPPRSDEMETVTPENEDEVRSHRRPHLSHDLEREATAILARAAPVIGPLVRGEMN